MGILTLVQFLKTQGKLDEAAVSFQRATEIAPDIAEAHYNLGFLIHEQGKLDSAAASLQRAIELKPDFSDAHYLLARLAIYTQKKPSYRNYDGTF